MPTSAGGARFGVRFDELAFSEDIRHATPAGRQVAGATRQRLQADGAYPSEFKRCDPDARDGTRLPNCLRVYLPTPDGRWRMMFEVLRDTTTGELVSHTWRSGRAPRASLASVYHVAHQRLHYPADQPEA